MVQLINTTFRRVRDAQQAGRTPEAQRIGAVVTQQMAPFTATMPKKPRSPKPPAHGPNTGPVLAARDKNNNEGESRS